jgi:hypothetical protein
LLLLTSLELVRASVLGRDSFACKRLSSLHMLQLTSLDFQSIELVSSFRYRSVASRYIILGMSY